MFVDTESMAHPNLGYFVNFGDCLLVMVTLLLSLYGVSNLASISLSQGHKPVMTCIYTLLEVWESFMWIVVVLGVWGHDSILQNVILAVAAILPPLFL